MFHHRPTLGMIGGLSPESTMDYYRFLNRSYNETLGGLHGARMLVLSLNLAEFYDYMHGDKIPEAQEMVTQAAVSLEKGGADFIAIACNTAHVAADTIRKAVSIPLVHIVDVLGENLARQNITTIGLLGSLFTMQGPFYQNHLRDHFGIETLIPEGDDLSETTRIIYDELCFGKVLEPSRKRFQRIAAKLSVRGAQALVLGCTELGMIVRPEDVPGMPVFDTTRLHCEKVLAILVGDQPLETMARQAS